MESTRQKKFAKEMQRAIAGLLQREVEPLIGGLITVNHVSVTPDLQVVRVYLTTLPEDKLRHALTLLGEENPAFRKLLAQEIRHQVRYVPTVEFYADDTLEKANRLDQLFEEIQRQDAERKKPTDDTPTPN